MSSFVPELGKKSLFYIQELINEIEKEYKIEKLHDLILYVDEFNLWYTHNLLIISKSQDKTYYDKHVEIIQSIPKEDLLYKEYIVSQRQSNYFIEPLISDVSHLINLMINFTDSSHVVINDILKYINFIIIKTLEHLDKCC